MVEREVMSRCSGPERLDGEANLHKSKTDGESLSRVVVDSLTLSQAIK